MAVRRGGGGAASSQTTAKFVAGIVLGLMIGGVIFFFATRTSDPPSVFTSRNEFVNEEPNAFGNVEVDPVHNRNDRKFGNEEGERGERSAQDAPPYIEEEKGRLNEEDDDDIHSRRKDNLDLSRIPAEVAPYVQPDQVKLFSDREMVLPRSGKSKIPQVKGTIDSTIFIAIAAYRDVECGLTLMELFEKAANPSRIHVGIIQNLGDDEELAQEETCGKYYRLANCVDGGTHPICANAQNIVIKSYPSVQGKGPVDARHKVQVYYLQSISIHGSFNF